MGYKGRRFKRIPEIIEAVQWDGFNVEEVQMFGGDQVYFGEEGRSYHLVLGPRTAGLILPIGVWLIRGVEGRISQMDDPTFNLHFIEVPTSQMH